jgi:hypothetical protein
MGVAKWRGVGVICLERQYDKVSSTYGSGEDETRHEAVAALVTRS